MNHFCFTRSLPRHRNTGVLSTKTNFQTSFQYDHRKSSERNGTALLSVRQTQRKKDQNWYVTRKFGLMPEKCWLGMESQPSLSFNTRRCCNCEKFCANFKRACWASFEHSSIMNFTIKNLPYGFDCCISLISIIVATGDTLSKYRSISRQEATSRLDDSQNQL